MSRQRLVSLLAVALLLGAGSRVLGGALAIHTETNTGGLGSAFTYQGRLTDGGQPASGKYDFKFTLRDAGGNQVGSAALLEDVTVTDGLFTVKLDFGVTAFGAEARSLEAGVRPGASTGSYTTLAPSQELTPAPFALYAPSAGNADLLDGQDSTAFWKLGGNTVSTGGSVLGTLDSKPLELQAGGQRALRIEPNPTSPNLIGGYGANSVTSGVVGATIAGGGYNPDRTVLGSNGVTDNFGTVSGGVNNQAGNGDLVPNNAVFATVDGGSSNVASANNATVGGGLLNVASGGIATVGGGARNTASGNVAAIGGGLGNQATAAYATIAGGGRTDANDPATGNRVTDDYGTVGGGGNNQAGDGTGDATTAPYATVGGGLGNQAMAAYATIAGGGRSDPNNPATGNRVTDSYGTIGGGGNNQAGDNTGLTTSASYATVAGGLGNIASGDSSSIGGGVGNFASGFKATIGGGQSNEASGSWATVPGGLANMAQGESSFAAGQQAKAMHAGAFVWADDNGGSFASTGANQFLIRASGGVGIGTNAPQAKLDVAGNLSYDGQKVCIAEYGFTLLAPSGWTSAACKLFKDALSPAYRYALGCAFSNPAAPFSMGSYSTTSSSTDAGLPASNCGWQ
jgi:trimeric autotransporter adhesin